MSRLRAIRSRHHGVRHGPITRLIDPSDLGELLKPFVFLDFFNAEVQRGFGFGMHPHSGIATLTWQPGSDVLYEDTTGKNGLLKAGGLEWMLAGGGAWHQGQLMSSGQTVGFQLWVPLPPEIEAGPSLGQYIPPDRVPVKEVSGGRVRVLLGSLEEASSRVESSIHSHQDMNYFVVELQAGALWEYAVPTHHDVAWSFVFGGEGLVQESRSLRELIVMGEAGNILIGAARTPASVIVGTARRHDHPLVLGYSSIHTSGPALKRGQAEIDRLGQMLRAAGRIV